MAPPYPGTSKEARLRAYDVDGRGRIVAFWISTDGVVGPTRYPEPPPGSIAEELRRGGAGRVIDDLAALQTGTHHLLAEQRQWRGMRSSLAVSLDAAGRRLGSLHVDHGRPNVFGAEELALVQALVQELVEAARPGIERALRAARCGGRGARLGQRRELLAVCRWLRAL